MTDSCPKGGSDLQVEGLNQVTLNTKLEMQYDRLGVSTVSVQNINCKAGAAVTSAATIIDGQN